MREISDGYATPAAPICKTNTPTQFPTTLTTFAAIEMYMVTWVFPMLRQSAAPASYTARNGRESVVIKRYSSQADSTSVSIFPKSSRRSGTRNAAISTVSTRENTAEIIRSCSDAREAASSLLLPIY